MVDTANVLAAQVAETSTGADPDPSILARSWTAAQVQPLRAQIYDSVQTRLQLAISLTDRHGMVLYDSARPHDVGRDNSHWNDVLRTLRGEYGARATLSDPNDPASTWLHVAAPVRRHDELIGVLTVALPSGTLDGLAASARWQFIASAVIVTAVMAGLALLITAWITQPLALLTRHVQRAAAGERIPVPDLGSGEIAALGAAMQQLRRELDGRSYIVEYIETLTHELKSPLAGLRAAAELLQEDLPAADRVLFITNIHRESQRLQALVDRLLAQAALERRERLEDVTPINLTAVMNDVCVHLSAIATQRQVTVTCTGAGESVGESFLVSQALENLLKNALEFSPPNSVIEVTIATHEVTIRDHGPGIPTYALPRIGERFYSLPRPDSGRKSTGLGLAFAHNVARLHGGTLRVINHPDGGVEAHMTFHPG